MSHSKCDFGKYEILYRGSLVNLKVVKLLFGTNELVPGQGFMSLQIYEIDGGGLYVDYIFGPKFCVESTEKIIVDLQTNLKIFLLQILDFDQNLEKQMQNLDFC